MISFSDLSKTTIAFIMATSGIAAAGDHEPIWSWNDTPVAIGLQVLDDNGTVEIPVNRATSWPIRSITGFSATTTSGQDYTDILTMDFASPVVNMQIDPEKTLLEPVLVTLDALTIEGVEEVSFFLNQEFKAKRTFAFPAQDPMPETVAVAGEFNGWNQASDVMKLQDDGSMAATVSIKPGRYTYKYVIDGDWVSDPTNPVTDGSGYNNSVLVIEGSSTKAANLQYLSSAHLSENGHGTSTFGGIRSTAPINSVTGIINNRLLEPGEVEITNDQNHVVLSPQGVSTKAENIISILVETSAGKHVVEDFILMFDSAPRTPRDEIIYYVVTDRFRDGNPENNPKAPTEELHPMARYVGGDWEGVREKLQGDYFSDLGVTTIWLAPVTENTMKAETDALPPNRLFTSYHGYWPTSFVKTNPAFGTMDDLRGLVSDAHNDEIAVIFDFVANHVHEDHPLIKSQPDLATELELGDGELNIREFDAHPLTTWFDKFLPTLDYVNNPDARSVAIDASLYWLAETNADGFRHDATKHIAIPFWQELTDEINTLSRNTGRRYYQVGETIGSRDTIMLNTGTDQLDGQFDFPLLFNLTPTFARMNSDLGSFADSVVESWETYPRASIMSPLIGNHDVSRFMGHAEEGDLPEGVNEKEVGYENPPKVDDPLNYTKIEAAFAMLFALPGAPMVYYGDEIGMTGAHDPDNRRPFPWDEISQEQEELRDNFKELTTLREESVALRRGNLEVIGKAEDWLILERTSPEQTMALVMAVGDAHPEKTAVDVDDLIEKNLGHLTVRKVLESDNDEKRFFRYAFVELKP